MFDLGWQEFLIIAFVLVIVVGPKDLPKVLKTVTNGLKQIRQMAFEFHRNIENMADEADLKEVKNSFNEIKNSNIDTVAKKHFDPTGDVAMALNQAKKSADIANNVEEVKDTFKTVGEESLETIVEEKKDSTKNSKADDNFSENKKISNSKK